MALVHVSNMLGSKLDTAYVAELAHKVPKPPSPSGMFFRSAATHAGRCAMDGRCDCACSNFIISGPYCAQVGARLLLDCSQSVPNMPVDVQSLGADWIVATGHKMCGPTGIGFLWGR